MFKLSIEMWFVIGIVVLLLLAEAYRLMKDRIKSILLMVLLGVAAFIALKWYFPGV